MFNGKNASTILKMEGSDYAVGTEDGMHVVNMDSGEDNLHVLQGMIATGMTYVGDQQVLVGAGEYKDYVFIKCGYYLEDTKNGDTNKLADTDRMAVSIQLLSNKHTLALSFECGGKVNLINYKSGNQCI